MCVIVDKLDKIGADAVVELLLGQGVAEAAGRQIVASLSLKSVDELKLLMGDTDDGGAVDELVTIFEMAEAYGFADWILFDASVAHPSPNPSPNPGPIALIRALALTLALSLALDLTLALALGLTLTLTLSRALTLTRSCAA